MPMEKSVKVPVQMVLPLTEEVKERMQKHLDAQGGGTRELFRRLIAAGLDALDAVAAK